MEGKTQLVLATCHPSSKGGISTWTRLLQKRLAVDERFEVSYIYPAYAEKWEIPAASRTQISRVLTGLVVMVKRVVEFKRMLATSRKDVLHLTTSGSLALVRDIWFLRIAKKYHMKIVYHIRFGRLPQCAKRDTWEWRLFKIAMSEVDCVIPIDRETEKTLKEHFPTAKIVYVPNLIDVSNIEKIKTRREKTVTFVGWCVKTKGVEELLEAWERIYKEFPAYKLQMVGPIANEYRESLVQRFDCSGVSFLGEKSHSDTLSIISATDLFVLPSYTEGFPNVVLEAMAMGKPIVATDVGAIPDILDGCGIVIPSRDKDALYEAIKCILEDKKLQVELGIKAKEKLLGNYTFDTVYEQYAAIWTGGEYRACAL